MCGHLGYVLLTQLKHFFEADRCIFMLELRSIILGVHLMGYFLLHFADLTAC
ncbi:hypothetical protein D3C71_2021310 [compost metagenome]